MVHGFINSFDPARGMPATAQHGRARGRPHRGAHAGRVAQGEGRHLRRHGRLRRQGSRQRAHGRRRRRRRRSLRAELSSIACPTTVIVGEHDHPLVDQAPELAAEVADGRLTVIPGAYHSPQLTHAAEWRAAVEAHLAWVRRPGGRSERRLATAGRRSDRARRHGRRHPAPRRRDVGLG